MSSSPLAEIYERLLAHFGPQHWWPAASPFEVLVGAVLTQNTNWANVEKALANLKDHDLLSLDALLALNLDELAQLIRPSGYYNLKARRLHNLLTLIAEYGDLTAFLAQEQAELREQLLSVKGIGPETADSIILYGAGQPAFVVDAYTFRFLRRHGLVGEESSYEEMQELFTSALPLDAPLFNEYHALIVRLAKEYCLKRRPRCQDCPLAQVTPIYLEEE
ncbi:MAG: endonuclease III domain-containing protein [Thermodesulfobacteriota bacterium]